MPSGYATVSGKSVEQLLADFGEKAKARLAAGLYKEAQDILSESQPLVPVDTGALRASGYVAEPVIEGDKITVELGYGGPAAQINPKTGESTQGYALIVHENLESHHPVGQALYLSTPFNEHRTGMVARVIANAKGIP